MKLHYYCGEASNFGDALNAWLWPRLLPGFFDEDAATAFLGIGSTLGEPPPDAKVKIVFGAGYAPHYHPIPAIDDGSWRVYFVRGPRTAQRLHLPPEKAIGDAALLMYTERDLFTLVPRQVSFMPHWESMARGNWAQVCERAGVTLIDPRGEVEAILAQLTQSRLVIAEAMHGAIVADALRIPWLPLVPLNPIHRDKWFDWAEALHLRLHPKRLWPSRLAELRITPARLADGATRAEPALPRLRSQLKQRVQHSALGPWVDERLTDLAAYRLRSLAQSEGMLSDERILTRAVGQMQEQLAQLQKDYAR